MIFYVKGDATKPEKIEDENRMIVHICNNKGGWGRGFVMALSSRWPEPERRYREWYKFYTEPLKYDGGCKVIGQGLKCDHCNNEAEYFGGEGKNGSPMKLCVEHNSVSLPLGEIQIVPVKDEQGKLFVCNMIAQNGYVTKDNPVAVDYEALHRCLTKLNGWMRKYEEVKKLLVYPNHPESFSVHMPRIGCGLAGGTWDKVEFIIKITLNYVVSVYDLE